MEQKLQELLDKVYSEGVTKGQEVASTIVRDAERKAEHILEEAQKQADEIRRQAREEAEELRLNVASELRLSAQQSINALQQQISRLIITKAVSEPTNRAFSDTDFIKRAVETLIQNWHSRGGGGESLSLLLPEKEREALGQYFLAKTTEALDGTLEVTFSDKLDKGFRIGPADGRYVISFTEKDFETFFSDYLRPKTKAILYGED